MVMTIEQTLYTQFINRLFLSLVFGFLVVCT
jgi:hypothetical protein